MTNLPKNGQIIIFEQTPIGSYTRPGEAYRVHHNGKKGHDYRFESVDRGSATYDRPHLVARSVWHEVERS